MIDNLFPVRKSISSDQVLPLPPQLAAQLRGWTGERGQLFPGSWFNEPAVMTRKDMETARTEWLKGAPDDATRIGWDRSDFLKEQTEDGYADFHALRHGFSSRMGSRGVHPKVAMKVARHSTECNLGIRRSRHWSPRNKKPRKVRGFLRGAAEIRTRDGGFAIRCLSHLATAPYCLLIQTDRIQTG
jgi:integrase